MGTALYNKGERKPLDTLEEDMTKNRREKSTRKLWGLEETPLAWLDSQILTASVSLVKGQIVHSG